MIRLRELRQKRNISMKQLGDTFGVAESTISLYETEKRKVDTDMLIKLADFFNVSTDYLLGITDKRNPPTASDNIGFDDFTYAMHNETKELTDEDKEMLLDMAKMLKKRLSEKKSKD